MAKKKTRKWNRANYFARKKSTPRQVGHPVYVYGERKNFRKYLTFTHKPKKGEEDQYERLKHNIDPDFDGVDDVYVKKKYDVSKREKLREPDKKYRIHDEDKETIKKYKK